MQKLDSHEGASARANSLEPLAMGHEAHILAPSSATAVAAEGILAHENPADRRPIIIAALSAATVGALLYNILPLYLGSAADANRLGARELGFLGSAFFFGFNFAGCSAFLWVRRANWRTVCLSMLPLIAAMLLISMETSNYPALLGITAAAGVAFGVLFTIGSVIVGDTSDPARWYGVKVATESSFGAILLFVLPWLVLRDYGFKGVVGGVLVTILLLLPLQFLLPPAWDKAATKAPVTVQVSVTPVSLVGIGCALMALLTIFAGGSAIWAFLERIGTNQNFAAGPVGTLLGVSLFMGVGGSFAVAAIGDRFGTVLPFAVSAGAVVAGMWFLAMPGSFALYAIGASVFMIGWSAAVPLSLAQIAVLDHDGRFVTLIVPALGIGSMIGPGVAGWLYEVGSLPAVLMFTAAASIAAALLVSAARRVSTVLPAAQRA